MYLMNVLYKISHPRNMMADYDEANVAHVTFYITYHIFLCYNMILHCMAKSMWTLLTPCAHIFVFLWSRAVYHGLNPYFPLGDKKICLSLLLFQHDNASLHKSSSIKPLSCQRTWLNLYRALTSDTLHEPTDVYHSPPVLDFTNSLESNIIL